MAHLRVPAHRCMLLAICMAAVGSAAGLIVDPSVQYQTMDGFGAAIADWLYDHNNDSAYVYGIVNDLGISMMRLFLPTGFEPQNGTFSTSGSVATMLEVGRKLHAAGLRRVVLDVFTPPGWMKQGPYSASCSGAANECGGTLQAVMYDAFAQYYARYIDTVEQRCGLSVCAISPENEPAWAQPYGSCVYSYTQMRDIVKALGPTFANDGLPVRIFSAEDLFTNTWLQYASTLFADTAARRYSDIVAIHQQNIDGTTPGIVADYRSARQRVETFAQRIGKAPFSLAFWNSEISGYPDGWAGAFSMAQGYVISLRDARMNALLFGSPSIPSSAGQNKEALMVDRQPTERYYVAKQFYRYIRPGAVAVGDTCDDSTVMTVAFVHPANHTISIVLVNTDAGSKTVSLQGPGLPSFVQVRSSQSETCDTIGTVTTSVVLPPSSITTLYGTGYALSNIPRPDAAAGRVVPQRLSAASVFGLDGRRVTAAARQARVCVVVERGAAGRAPAGGSLVLYSSR